MLKDKKKKLSLLLSGIALFTLASCSTEQIKLPSDYEENLFPNLSDDVVQGTKEEYYDNLTDSDSVYKKTLNQALLKLSTIAHDNTGGTDGSDVVNVINDDYEGSVADGTYPTDAGDNLLNRAEDNLLSISKNGTYEEDNLFKEKLYVDSLKRAFTLPEDPLTSNPDPAGVLVTPELEFDDVFKGNKEAYIKYMEKYLYEDMRINYLVTEYIYTVSYSSIGNSNARNVEIISLTDREDQPGAAKSLLDAYVNDYVFGDKGSDAGFEILSRLWKGITQEVADNIDQGDEDPDQYSDRYDSVKLSSEEENWMKEHNLIVDSGEDSTYTYYGTLAGKVVDDQKKLIDGQNNMNLADTSLESTYTGSYTYDFTTGVRRAIDDIATTDLVTNGIYLQSDGVSGIPTSISDRIFSTNITIDKSEIADMKANPGTNNYDITTYGADGYRYLTVANTVATPGSGDTLTPDDIIFYDKDSRTYYLVRILDVINTQSMSKSSTTSIYDTDEKREQIGREVAYVMSTTGSYKTEAIVYWLRRVRDIKYSDDGFLEYMKSNYPELFRTESPYDDETQYPTISLQ